MDKNSVIGFILMGLVLFGFTAIQSKKAQEQLANAPVQTEIVAEDAPRTSAAQAPAQAPSGVYRDSRLEQAHLQEGEIVILENELFQVSFNTKGAKPHSAKIKDYYNYDSTELYIFREGQSDYNIRVYVGEYISTSDFVFDIAEKTDSSLVMRLPFDCGGYIEQRYEISQGSYQVKNYLSFVGMTNIPRNVSSFDLDIYSVIPRMEKGYKNETQYSKLSYYFNGDKKPEELGRGRSAGKDIKTRLEWFAFQQQFFSQIVRAPQEFLSGHLDIKYAQETDPERNLMTCTARMSMEYRPDATVTVPLEFYYGPNSYKILKSYDCKYEKIIPLGGSLVGWFTKFFIIPMFNFLHRFIANYGLIILIMTIVIKLVVLPFTYKSYASSAKMQALKPLMEDINKKYPKQEDALKKQQATMDLYKKADCSPMGGCLPTLLTLPILWAMFRFFPASIELRQQSFLWAEDLSGYDSIIDFGSRVPLLGDHLSLFALLMAIVMWLYSKMTTAQQVTANDPSAASMKFMSVWMMPIMMFFICNNLSSGLSYYYLLSQLISMLEIWLIKKSIKPEAVLAKVAAAKNMPQKKSKWQQRLEEAQKMQQQQLRQQGRK